MPVQLPFIIDGGNAFTKWVIGKTEGMFVHALAELTQAEWEYATDRYGRSAPLDLMRIGEHFYAVGETAENYTVTRRVGRPKYSREYYGVIFANALARAFYGNQDALEEGPKVIASHATDDFGFRSSLIKSIKGRWHFECGGTEFKVNIKDVLTFEESYGGYCRRAVHWNGKKWTMPLAGYSAGVVDIGGGTCGVIAVNENMILQPSMSKSGSIGMLDAVERLKKELFRRYNKEFQNVQKVPEERLRAALATGVFRGFGKELDCKREVQTSLAPLMNEVSNLWVRYLNGGAGLDVIILTGGGNGTLYERTMEVIGRDGDTGVILSDEPESIQYGNVRGARDFEDIMEAERIL